MVRVLAITIGLLVRNIIVKWGFILLLTLHAKEVTTVVLDWPMTANGIIVLHTAEKYVHSPKGDETNK